MKRLIFYYYAPALIWAAIILSASSPILSAEHTGHWIQALAAKVTGSPFSPDTFAIVHFAIRKLGHLTEYGIFGALAFRAFRGERRGWSIRWATAAITSAALLASIDEWHQTFVPGRTGAVTDVLIDVSAAALAQFLIRRYELF